MELTREGVALSGSEGAVRGAAVIIFEGCGGVGVVVVWWCGCAVCMG